MAQQDHFSGGIDEILRQLKPSNVTVPLESPKEEEPLADYKPGNIDAILDILQPKPSSRPIDPTKLKMPCLRCKRFDLSNMDAGYAEINQLCPTCRHETNTGLPTSPPMAEKCVKCGFDLMQMDKGYAAMNTMCPSCREKSRAAAAGDVSTFKSGGQHVNDHQQPEKNLAVAADSVHVVHAGAQQVANEPKSAQLTGSALTRLEHEIASQEPVSYSQQTAELENADHPTAHGALTGQPSTTGVLRGHMKNLELSVAIATSWPESSNLTPKAQLEKRKAVARTKMDVARRQKEVDDELERTKAEIARKETEKAEAKK